MALFVVGTLILVAMVVLRRDQIRLRRNNAAEPQRPDSTHRADRGQHYEQVGAPPPPR